MPSSFFLIDRLSNLWYNQYVRGHSAHSPISYRGYYYDREYGFYCLGTRFYDPVTRRFISADTSAVITTTPTALTDKNLYAYCDNNPVMRVDNGGEFWNFVIGGIVGGIVGGVVAALNGEDASGIIVATIAGVASGVVAATGLGMIAQASISAGISAAADFANQTIDITQKGKTFSDYNLESTLEEAAFGFATSVAGTMLGNIVDTKITKNIAKSNVQFDKYLGKTFTAGLRKEAGKSSSALIRQANKHLAKSNILLNTYRGLSSVIGSGVSLGNIAR